MVPSTWRFKIKRADLRTLTYTSSFAQEAARATAKVSRNVASTGYSETVTSMFSKEKKCSHMRACVPGSGYVLRVHRREIENRLTGGHKVLRSDDLQFVRTCGGTCVRCDSCGNLHDDEVGDTVADRLCIAACTSERSLSGSQITCRCGGGALRTLLDPT